MTDAEIQKLLNQYPATKLPDGAYITCPCRLSWISLAAPTGSKDRPDDKRFRATLLFPPNADLSVLRNAASEAAVAKWGDKTSEIVKSSAFKRPLLPQDEKAGKYDGYAVGGQRSNVTTMRKPPIYAHDMTAIDPATPGSVYPGVWARVKITVRAYDQNGGRGVAFDLVSIQKIADDTEFGGAGVDAAEGFGPVGPVGAVNGAAGAPVGSKPAAALF